MKAEPVSPASTDLGQVHQIGSPKGRAGSFIIPSDNSDRRKNITGLLFGWHELTGDENNIIDQKQEFELAKIDEIKGEMDNIFLSGFQK